MNTYTYDTSPRLGESVIVSDHFIFLLSAKETMFTEFMYIRNYVNMVSFPDIPIYIAQK